MKITEKRLKQIIKEELDLHSSHLDHPDQEGSMAKRQLEHISEYAHELAGMLDDNTQLESWVQSKITLAQDYISKVKHYLEDQLGHTSSSCGPVDPIEDVVIDDAEMIALAEQ